eukprot:1151565-Pelagomonas_calceolata.AAC.1
MEQVSEHQTLCTWVFCAAILGACFSTRGHHFIQKSMHKNVTGMLSAVGMALHNATTPLSSSNYLKSLLTLKSPYGYDNQKPWKLNCYHSTVNPARHLLDI